MGRELLQLPRSPRLHPRNGKPGSRVRSSGPTSARNRFEASLGYVRHYLENNQTRHTELSLALEVGQGGSRLWDLDESNVGLNGKRVNR